MGVARLKKENHPHALFLMLYISARVIFEVKEN